MTTKRGTMVVRRGPRYCLLPGPRRRSRIWDRQAAKNQQTLIRNPTKGEQGSFSPQSGPAKPFHEKAVVVNGRRGDRPLGSASHTPSPHFHPHSLWAHVVSPVPFGVRSRRVLPSHSRFPAQAGPWVSRSHPNGAWVSTFTADRSCEPSLGMSLSRYPGASCRQAASDSGMVSGFVLPLE